RGGRPPRAGPSARLNPVTSVQFTAQLLVAAEPRLSFSQSGPPPVLERVDPRGHSLIPPRSHGPGLPRFSGAFGRPTRSVAPLQAQLQRPATVGEFIKRVRGAIPLTVSSRRPDPLVVPLTQGTGKRFENADVELTLHDIRPRPNSRQTLIELSVKSHDR